MAEPSRKRKMSQVELSSKTSSCGSSQIQKSKMYLRSVAEQRLFMKVLRSIALPRVNNHHESWLCINLWTAVTHEYNKRADEVGVPQRIMTSLIQLGRRLQFCHCRKGEQQHCSCIISEFPVIDGAGEPSSRVSLGAGSMSNSEYSDNEITHSLDYISQELIRLREAKKFTYEKLSSYLDAWEHELRIGVGQSSLFFNANSDRLKIKISNFVLKRQNRG